MASERGSADRCPDRGRQLRRRRRLLRVHDRTRWHAAGSARRKPPVCVQASLAGRPFETFLLDVGFRQGDELSAETLATAGLLGFAEIAPVEVEAVPVELQVAEKLHAYTRRYDGGRINTRAKDRVDLTLVAELAVVEAAGLRQAVEATFADREAHLVPTELPLPPRQWAAQFHQLAEAVGVPGGLEAGHRLAAGLLDPVLSGEVTSGVWDPEHASWVDADTMPVNVPTPTQLRSSSRSSVHAARSFGPAPGGREWLSHGVITGLVTRGRQGSGPLTDTEPGISGL